MPEFLIAIDDKTRSSDPNGFPVEEGIIHGTDMDAALMESGFCRKHLSRTDYKEVIITIKELK